MHSSALILTCTVWIAVSAISPLRAQEPSPPPARPGEAKAGDADAGAPREAAGAQTLRTVTVTATRTERALEEVPESVSVVEAETLERDQVQSLDDALRHLPNVDMAGGPRRVRETPVIRGMTDERVVVLVDGVRQNFQSGHKGTLFLEPDIMKTIEVVRGPASALYGSDALGGVVALTTKDPSDFLLGDQPWGFMLRGGYQSANEEKMGNPAVYGRLGEEWSWLLHYTVRDAENLRQGGGDTLEHSAEKSASTFAKLVWDPEGAGIVRFALSDYLAVQEMPVVGEADDTTGLSLVDRTSHVQTVSASYASEGLPTGLWHPAASVYTQRMELEEDRIRIDRYDEISWTTTGLDLRNSSLLPGDAVEQTLTYGAEYYTDEQESERNGSALLVFPNASAQHTGVYAQDELVTGSWRIIPGLRYDHFTTEADTIAGTNENDHLSPKLGVVYAIDAIWSLHALYGQGFRAPSIQELYISGFHHGGSPEGIFVPNPDLQPEKAENIEAGFTAQGDGFAPADEFRVRATAFRNRVTDFIEVDVSYVENGDTESGVTCESGGDCLFYRPRNVQNAELTGGELEAGYASVHWSVSSTYSATRGQDLDDDEPLNNVFPDKWVTEFQVSPGERDLRGGARRTAVAAQRRVTDSSLETPGYETFDVFATVEPQQGRWLGFRADFGIDNLTDEKYRRHLSVLNEAGRSIKITVAQRF